MLAKTGENRRFIGRFLSIPRELTSSHVFTHEATRRDGPSLWGVTLPVHHMLFADPAKMIAVDSEDDRIGDEPRPPNTLRPRVERSRPSRGSMSSGANKRPVLGRLCPPQPRPLEKGHDRPTAQHQSRASAAVPRRSSVLRRRVIVPALSLSFRPESSGEDGPSTCQNWNGCAER